MSAPYSSEDESDELSGHVTDVATWRDKPGICPRIKLSRPPVGPS